MLPVRSGASPLHLMRLRRVTEAGVETAPPEPLSLLGLSGKIGKRSTIEDYAKAIGYKVKVSFEPHPAT